MKVKCTNSLDPLRCCAAVVEERKRAYSQDVQVIDALLFMCCSIRNHNNTRYLKLDILLMSYNDKEYFHAILKFTTYLVFPYTFRCQIHSGS